MNAFWKTLAFPRKCRALFEGLAGSKDGADVLIVLLASPHVLLPLAILFRWLDKREIQSPWFEICLGIAALFLADAFYIWRAIRARKSKPA